jgi:hypothetical protein
VNLSEYLLDAIVRHRFCNTNCDEAEHVTFFQPHGFDVDPTSVSDSEISSEPSRVGVFTGQSGQPAVVSVGRGVASLEEHESFDRVEPSDGGGCCAERLVCTGNASPPANFIARLQQKLMDAFGRRGHLFLA